MRVHCIYRCLCTLYCQHVSTTTCVFPPSVLVGVSDAPRDSAHQRYLARVSEALGLIEYRQFRQDWLSYQKCSIDVFAFCKKTKLIFRGSRYVDSQSIVLLDSEKGSQEE